MNISRRNFLRYCGASAAALGLGAADLLRLDRALAAPGGPSVVWLQGSACTGCSMSFLNRISATAPVTAGDVLINSVNLAYHPNLMALAGEPAVARAKAVRDAGGYVLAVEGGVPMAYNNAACFAWSEGGTDVTFKDAVTDLASNAAAIICVGTCASWGGIPAAPPNPTSVKGVSAATGKTTINIAGCPPHPDWIVWAVVQLILGNPIPLDTAGRPTALYGRRIHDICPRREQDEAETFGVDGRCLEELGCRGPETSAECSVSLWNGKSNWCIDSNAPCLGCTKSGFPGSGPFYREDD